MTRNIEVALNKMWGFLIFLSLLLHISGSSFYRSPRQSILIPPPKCSEPDAFTLKCMDQNTQEIPSSGGEFKRHENILIEMVQISGACDFAIPEFLVLIIPPDEYFDTGKVKWDEAIVIDSNPSQTTKYDLAPYTIKKTGRITIEITPIELKSKQKVADSKTCEVNVVYAKPEVYLVGGSEKLYKANAKGEVKCDAKNFNNEDQSQKGLTFSWQCSTSKGSAPQFCSPTNMEKFKDQNTLIIPLAAAKEENNFDITLEVGLSEASGFETRLSQKVRFQESIGTMKVKCLKNCPPKAEVTLSSMSTVLKAKCFHCDPNVVITWSIRDSKGEESVDYNYLKKRDGPVFYLKAGALKNNKKYRVTAQEKGLEQTSLYAEFELDTKLPAPVRDCSVDPPSGVAFETGFVIKCTYFPGDITFEINSVNNERTTLLAKTNDLESEVFLLPADVSLLVNVYYGQIGFTQAINLSIDVKEVLDLSNKTTDSEINAAVSNKMNEALDLINQDHPELALQGLAAIVSEYANLPPNKDDLKKSLDKAIMNVIAQVNIDSPAKAQQVADTLSQITGRYNVSSDPEISAQSAALCTKAGDVLLNDAKHAKRPELMRNQIENTVESLSLCSQAGLNENRDSVEATNSSVTVPEELPVIPTDQPVEFYPDYTDDEHSSENKAKFEKSIESIEQICFTNGKMLAYTMVPEEDPIVTIVGSLTIAVARMYCEDTSFLIVETPDANLKPNTDCQSENIPIIDILICSTKKNPFWYIDNIPMLTPVIYTMVGGNQSSESSFGSDVFEGRNEKAGFKDALHLTLPVHENVTIELKIHEAPLPDKPIGALNEGNFYEKVSTHRIFVFKNRSFTISFENMTGTDMSYDIMVTSFEKPSYEQFKSLHDTITPDDNVIDITQIHNYDCFWYLSLLPNVNMNATSNKIYAFSVSTTGCYTWNVTAKQWYYACHGAAGQAISQNITCYCTSGQIFTGYVIDNKVTYEETLILDFELELKFCWIIYGVVMVTFVLFCLLLFLYSLERDDNILDNVFFVGDVPSFYQYAYVIHIKTGAKRHSGTTSNVSIKLCGNEGDSMEHVLNYPDPNLSMLRRGTENWFVVATEKPLGDLKQIEIWFDSIGNNAKWFCSKINIHDIQTGESWSFVLEEWFDVTKDHNMFILKPTEKIKAKTKEKTKNRALDAIKSFLGRIKGEVNLWNLFSTDPLLTGKERVSLIFSILLLMYLTIMIFYAIPHFDESDVIDPNRFGLHEKLIWTPIAGSTAAFLMHIPLIYFIKRGKFLSLDVYKFKKFSFVKFALNFCWILISLNCLTAATLLIICGFWIPMDTSLLWLVSVILAIFFNIFILQTISCIALSYFVRLSAQVPSFTKGIIEYIDLQRTWIYKRFGTVGLRPYFNHLYFSLDPITLKERLKWAESKSKIKELLEDLLMISLYVAMLYVVLMIDKEPEAINSNGEIKRLVMGKVVNNEMTVKTVEDIETYTENVLLPSFQSMHWYGKFIQNNPGMTKDFSNKYLGVLRIRQQRTKEIQCEHPEIIKFLNMTCRPDLFVSRETEKFARGWKPETEFSNITTERMAKIWKHVSATIDDAPSFFGEYDVYPGGGYIAPLGRNYKNSLINLEYLKKHRWLDLRTRAVFIEFLTYNPNVNVFNSVTVAFEVPSTGHVARSLKLQTRKFLVVNRDTLLTRNVLYVCFLIMLAGLLLRILSKVIIKKSRYFYDVWQIFDILIALLSGLAIWFYYARSEQILTYITEISDAKNNDFVNYFQLFRADSSFTFLTACLVFVATLRLWKLLRFMVIVQITEKTLKDSAIPLLVCLIFQMVYLVAFSISGALMFGSNIENFRNLRISFITLLLLSIGFASIDSDQLSQEPLGIIFYMLCMLFTTFFLTTYVAIINIYYGEAQDYYGDEPGFVQPYLSEKWTYYKTLMLVRFRQLRGGEDIPIEDLIIKPTSERYDDCYAIAKNRLDGMAFISMCVLRNLEDKHNFGDQDFELMSKMIKSLFGEESSEKDIFFAIRDQHRIKLIDDRKITQIANICEEFINQCSIGYSRISRKFEKPWIEERILRINNLIYNVKLIERVLNNIQFN